ncbi:MAG: hypothetical protein ACRYGP_24465 [Janthinobacterium lividum]
MRAGTPVSLLLADQVCFRIPALGCFGSLNCKTLRDLDQHDVAAMLVAMAPDAATNRRSRTSIAFKAGSDTQRTFWWCSTRAASAFFDSLWRLQADETAPDFKLERIRRRRKRSRPV